MKGKKFSRLTVVSRAHNTPTGQAQWLCRCKCGKKTIIRGYQLRGGHAKSCGCLRTDVLNYPGRIYTGTPKHRHAIKGQISQEYHAWQNMKRRCLNPHATYYFNYGGRGITVCERWLHSFENFFKDMGPKPHCALTLERRNNDGNYEPSNCYWATRAEQTRNRRPRKKAS